MLPLSCDTVDMVQRAIHVVVNSDIPNTDDTIALLFKPLITRFVTASLSLLSVPGTIQLNDQLRAVTGKIDDVGTKRDLATKMQTLSAPLPNPQPYSRLPRCQTLSKTSCLGRHGKFPSRGNIEPISKGVFLPSPNVGRVARRVGWGGNLSTNASTR